MTAAATDQGITGTRADALYAGCSPGRTERCRSLRRSCARCPELRCLSRVSGAFQTLAWQRRIEQRHGTLRFARGHRIVRIVATGKEMRTDGCPLTLDGAPALRRYPAPALRRYPVGRETLGAVLEVVKGCAEGGSRLPRPGRIGQNIGRSPYTVAWALRLLHDDGQLTLIQRGRRRAAELPDGRRTL
jgi:hypothetical protein